MKLERGRLPTCMMSRTVKAGRKTGRERALGKCWLDCKSMFLEVGKTIDWEKATLKFIFHCASMALEIAYWFILHSSKYKGGEMTEDEAIKYRIPLIVQSLILCFVNDWHELKKSWTGRAEGLLLGCHVTLSVMTLFVKKIERWKFIWIPTLVVYLPTFLVGFGTIVSACINAYRTHMTQQRTGRLRTGHVHENSVNTSIRQEENSTVTTTQEADGSSINAPVFLNAHNVQQHTNFRPPGGHIPNQDSERRQVDQLLFPEETLSKLYEELNGLKDYQQEIVTWFKTMIESLIQEIKNQMTSQKVVTRLNRKCMQEAITIMEQIDEKQNQALQVAFNRMQHEVEERGKKDTLVQNLQEDLIRVQEQKDFQEATLKNLEEATHKQKEVENKLQEEVEQLKGMKDQVLTLQSEIKKLKQELHDLAMENKLTSKEKNLGGASTMTSTETTLGEQEKVHQGNYVQMYKKHLQEINQEKKGNQQHGLQSEKIMLKGRVDVIKQNLREDMERNLLAKDRELRDVDPELVMKGSTAGKIQQYDSYAEFHKLYKRRPWQIKTTRIPEFVHSKSMPYSRFS